LRCCNFSLQLSMANGGTLPLPLRISPFNDDSLPAISARFSLHSPALAFKRSFSLRGPASRTGPLLTALGTIPPIVLHGMAKWTAKHRWSTRGAGTTEMIYYTESFGSMSSAYMDPGLLRDLCIWTHCSGLGLRMTRDLWDQAGGVLGF
jgi:hypothetical protein